MLITDKDNKPLALYYPKSSRNLETDNTVVFVSEDEHMVQVGIWNKYTTDHNIVAHKHLPVARTTVGTHEMFYVESGKIRAYIFDDNDKPNCKLEMVPGDMLVQLAGGHTFDILEKGTVVIEVKNGPFMGKSMDKAPIEVEKW